jgi:hypothetical protein
MPGGPENSARLRTPDGSVRRSKAGQKSGTVFLTASFSTLKRWREFWKFVRNLISKAANFPPL